MRLVVDALLYLTVGGIQWRMLPTDFPPWQSVYTYFRKWQDDGTWRRMHDTLRVQRPKRVDDPAVWICAVDALLYLCGIQWRLPTFGRGTSVYTYFRKWQDDGTWRRMHDIRVRRSRPLLASIVHLQECEATMVANASQGGNGTFSSIQWDSYWPSWSLLPTCPTAMGHVCYSDEAAASARNCVSSGWTEPIVALCRRGLRSAFASVFGLFYARKGRKVSPYCPAVGLWNAPSLGSASIDAFAKIMNDSLQPLSPLSISL